MTLAKGDLAPAFALPGVDGATHALDDYGEARLLVLAQLCNHCPYVLAWEDRLNAVARDFADRGVRVAGLSSNDAEAYPEDSFDRMREHAAEKGFVFDYLYDEPQELARALGSERTPEVFVFDDERRLRYHGAIDDSREPGDVQRRYLRDALEALLADGEPPVAETAPVGCTVKWR